MSFDAWDVYGDLNARDPTTLTREQLALVSICDLRQEVNAGGFENYFRAWGGNTAPVALEALPALLGHEWAELLGEAMGLFGQSYPSDPDARADAIDEQDLTEELDQLDLRYYDVEASVDADTLLNNHANANPGAWA